MDLREFRLSTSQIETGCEVLNYQPFVLSDDVQTGVAYSWLHSADPRCSPPLVFRRQEYSNQWDKVTDSNARLRRMYDGFVRAIAERYPGASLLDVACNNGYFPVRAEMFGMGASAGIDAGGHYERSVRFLNEICGTSATFSHVVYQPHLHRAPLEGKYDVVAASAIMCHLPDPLNFLAFLASMAREAIFFFDQVVDSPELLVAYRPPHHALSDDRPFPNCFNRNTRLSRGLMELSLRQLGFKQVVELPWQDDWLLPHIRPRRQPRLEPTAIAAFGDHGQQAARGFDLLTELQDGSKHLAILAMR